MLGVRPFLLLALAQCCLGQSFLGNFYNTKAVRWIDVRDDVVRIKVGLGFKQRGSTPAAAYYLAIPKEQHSTLAYINVHDETRKIDCKVELAPKAEGGNGAVHYKVDFGNYPMDETVELTVSMVFADVLVPLPRSVEQGEQASMVYQDNHYWMSPYETRGQITKILLPSSELEVPIEITDAPTSVMGDIVQYGVYDNVPAYKYSPSTIHFKHSAPIVVATSSTRSVSVSHWGTVAFEESLELVNAGAELKGPFSREDFMKNPKSQGVGAANMLSAMLPADAQDITFYDEIGNISTSHLGFNNKNVIMTARPRYPLFGGWKTAFNVGYKVPFTSAVTAEAGEKYKLKVDFGVSFLNMTAVKHEIAIVLPEGSRDINVEAPFPHTESRGVSNLFLDTSGRPTVTITAKTLVSPEHNKPLTVTYRLSSVHMLRQPAMGAMTVLALVVAVLFVGSVTSSDDGKSGK